MKTGKPEIRLERLVNALSEDLAESSDLELIEAARDLRMDITMRGTAAFLGLKGLYFPLSAEQVLAKCHRAVTAIRTEVEFRRPEKS